jgi:Mor family transcriptional regulator
MGKVCMVCTHERRGAIEKDLLAGVSVAEVARRYRVSKYSVSNHRAMHLLHRPDARKRKGPDAATVGLRGFYLSIGSGEE